MGVPSPVPGVYEANAWVLLRRALTDESVLITLLPELTDQGRHYLEIAGITASAQCEELRQILALASWT